MKLVKPCDHILIDDNGNGLALSYYLVLETRLEVEGRYLLALRDDGFTASIFQQHNDVLGFSMFPLDNTWLGFVPAKGWKIV